SKDFAPLPTGIRHTPFNDIDALKQVINDKTCAFIVEPIQGESGVLPADKAFLQAARELCDQFQAALIFDEVQTGMGRTGKLFAHQHYGVTPDILSSAKALGCGFPIGAMLCTEKYATAFTPGSHGTTFGGNPLACAVGNAAFDMINNPTTYANIERQAQLLRDELADICGNGKVFAQIRGMGLLLGCVLNETYQGKAGDFVKAALQEKLMILQAGANVVRLAPSLLLTDEDRQEGVKRLKQTAQRFQAA
ncbi:MAG: aminotransferase class III-fold pyridoxal phosphate-dependent enzyme, partial [Neisseriaceae bacterium]|nr:aminotransferase class III-fold pyridoxal phosphate-dependent enzyme [Neisseriaceae bacterium]